MHYPSPPTHSIDEDDKSVVERWKSHDLPEYLGPKFGYVDIMYAVLEQNVDCPSKPGQSGHVNIGFGSDLNLFTSQARTITLFTGKQQPGVFFYMGKYLATKVQSMPPESWGSLDDKVCLFCRVL